MSVHNLIAELIAAGTPPQLVTAVSELITDNALLRLQLSTDNARRARDAERKRNYRENVRGCPVTVPGQSADLLPPKEKSPPIPPSKERTPFLTDTQKRVRARAYPEDFTFNEADHAAMRELGWGDAKAATELSKFKDHALAHSCLYADWHAAWRNWVRSPFQSSPKPNGGTNGHHANPAAIRRTSDAVAETLARRQLDLLR